MKKLLITLSASLLAIVCFGQTESEKLIELGKAYKDFMFRNEPTKDDLKQL